MRSRCEDHLVPALVTVVPTRRRICSCQDREREGGARVSSGRSVTQDPIEQALEKLGSYGVPVNEIGERVGGLVGQLGALDPMDIMEQLGSIDPKQIDVGELVGELQARFDALDPALKVPVMLAAGFVGARVVRWIVR